MHYKIEGKEKQNEMKRRPLTLDRLCHLKSPKKLQRQQKYQVNFEINTHDARITCKNIKGNGMFIRYYSRRTMTMISQY